MIRRFMEWFSGGLYTDRLRVDKYHSEMDKLAVRIFTDSWPELTEKLKREILKQVQDYLPLDQDSVYLRLTDPELVREFHLTIGRRFMETYGVKRKTIRIIASESGQTANCRIRLSVIEALRRFPDVASSLGAINSGGTGDHRRVADSA